MGGVAIVVGNSGQDGLLLQASLEKKGVAVIGLGRKQLSIPSSVGPVGFDYVSITDSKAVAALVEAVAPNYVYYLAAHHTSSEGSAGSFDSTEYAKFHEVHVIGLLNFLSAIRNYAPECRLFFAASSHVYESSLSSKQTEETPFSPLGFYGLTKAQGIMLCREFRLRHAVFASSGILYNHESVLRGKKFLSKKLIESAHLISLGRQKSLSLGNLSAEADWGYAPDFVEAFQLILATGKPDDFIVSTGESHTVREFVHIVFDRFGLSPSKYIVEDSNLLGRDVSRRVGDSSKLRNTTGWRPTYDFADFVDRLINDYLKSFDTIIVP